MVREVLPGRVALESGTEGSEGVSRGYWWEEILSIENSRCKGPGARVGLVSAFFVFVKSFILSN